MDVQALDIPDVKVITPKKFGDHRGFFSETYNQAAFEAAGVTADFVQDNHSRSAAMGTVRGLHMQAPPFDQGKLVRVVRGAIMDVAVDVRRGSPTYGQWVRAEISADNWSQIWVPSGFLHGFATLEPDTEVVYKVTAPYSAAHEAGVKWNDADLAIDWGGVSADTAVVSDKDSDLPAYKDFQSPFAMTQDATA